MKRKLTALEITNNENDGILSQDALEIQKLSEAIKLKPDDAEAYFHRGRAYSRLKEYDLALQDLNDSIRLNPNTANAYINRGYVHEMLRHDLLAIEDYSKAIRLKPDHIEAYYHRSNFYHRLGKRYNSQNYSLAQQHFLLATQDYNEIIRLKPDHALTYFNRADVYTYLGQNDLAVQDFSATIRLKPDMVAAYYERGQCWPKYRYDLKILDFSEAIKLKPDDASAYYYRATAYKDLRQYTLAFNDYTQAIRLSPDFWDAYYNRGSLHESLGQYEAALQDFSKVIELRNFHHFRRGNVYLKLGQTALAINDYSLAIELNKSQQEKKALQDLVDTLKKTDLFNFILSLPELRQINLLTQCLNENTVLGERFLKAEGRAGMISKSDLDILFKIREHVSLLTERMYLCTVFLGNALSPHVPSDISLHIVSYFLQLCGKELNNHSQYKLQMLMFPPKKNTREIQQGNNLKSEYKL
jgi:tetratricopeptide (TPR) repeat protein